MKKYILVNIFLLINSLSFAQNNQLDSKFDERVELLSIVFRLSEAREYMNNSTEKYTNSVDSYFTDYKNHKVVKMAKKIRRSNGVSYDAVMSLAVHLQIKKGNISFNQYLKLDHLDDRWGNKWKEFLVHLNDFYRVSQFHKFFNLNQELYAIATERFNEISHSIDIKWFENFFGFNPGVRYNIILSFTNRGNYGPKTLSNSGKEDVYSINCAWDVDKNGDPIYEPNIAHLIVHEFCHSFCNQLGEKYYPQMAETSMSYFKKVKELLKKQAYGSALTMNNEILVRSATIKYFKDHGAKEERINTLLKREYARGFLWIEDLYQSMVNYSIQHNQYSSLDDFMPQIVRLQKKLSVDSLFKHYNEMKPKIIHTSVKNNSTNISPDLKEIIIEFDHNMASYGITTKSNVPNSKIEWVNKEHTKLKLSVNLKQNSKYLLHFHDDYNNDQYGFPLNESLYLRFTTKKN